MWSSGWWSAVCLTFMQEFAPCHRPINNCLFISLNHIVSVALTKCFCCLNLTFHQLFIAINMISPCITTKWQYNVFFCYFEWIDPLNRLTSTPTPPCMLRETGDLPGRGIVGLAAAKLIVKGVSLLQRVLWHPTRSGLDTSFAPQTPPSTMITALGHEWARYQPPSHLRTTVALAWINGSPNKKVH